MSGRFCEDFMETRMLVIENLCLQFHNFYEGRDKNRFAVIPTAEKTNYVKKIGLSVRSHFFPIHKISFFSYKKFDHPPTPQQAQIQEIILGGTTCNDCL